MNATKPATEQGSLALLRRLFSEYGRPHLRAYVAGALLMGVGAAATS